MWINTELTPIFKCVTLCLQSEMTKEKFNILFKEDVQR